MRSEEDLGDSSNQATATSKDKPISRMVIRTPRTATSRATKDGTTALPKGKASGGRSASRAHGPPTAAAHAAAMLDVWPPLSAPGATIFDQHDDASHNATRISPRATVPAICDRDVFTPAGLSAAGGGATLYVLYDGFD